MSRSSALATVTLMCLVLLAATVAQAAEDVLGVIPREALGFVLVNRLGETDAKIQALGRQMELPVPSPLSMFKKKVGLQGVLDEKGSAAIVVMPGKEADSRPVALLFLPVTDYPQFLRQLKAENPSAKIVDVRVGDVPLLVGKRDGYAVVARPGHREVLQEALGAPERGPAGAARLRKWLARGDVAGMVTRRGVELFSVKAQEGLQQAKKHLAAIAAEKKPGIEAAVGVFGIYEKIVKAAGEEIQDYAFSARIDDGGNLRVAKRVRVTPGGQAAQILSQVKPAQRNLLAGLPDGPFVFALGGILPENMVQCLMQFSSELMKTAPGIYGLNAEQVDKLTEISSQSIKQLRGMSIVMGVGKPGDPIYSNVAVVETVDDSKAFLANYRKTIAAMNELLKGAQSSVLSPVNLREVEVGGVSALRLAMSIPKAPGAAEMPGYAEMMKKLFGPNERIVAFIAAANDHTIVASYTGRRLLGEILQAVKGTMPGLDANPELAKTAAMLPSGAQWVGYISPKGTIDFIKRVIPVLTPEGKTAPKLPEFPQTPPIGFAVRTAPDGLRSQTVVPAAVLKAIGGFVAEIKKTKAEKE
jgi:hypothetical protein